MSVFTGEAAKLVRSKGTAVLYPAEPAQLTERQKHERWCHEMQTVEIPAQLMSHAGEIESRAAVHWSCWSDLAYTPGLLFDGRPQHGGQAQVDYAQQGYFIAAWLRNIARDKLRTPELAKATLQALCRAKGPKGQEPSYLTLRAPGDTEEARCLLVDLREPKAYASGTDWLQCARNIKLELLSEWQRCVWRELWEYSP